MYNRFRMILKLIETYGFKSVWAFTKENGL